MPRCWWQEAMYLQLWLSFCLTTKHYPFVDTLCFLLSHNAVLLIAFAVLISFLISQLLIRTLLYYFVVFSHSRMVFQFINISLYYYLARAHISNPIRETIQEVYWKKSHNTGIQNRSQDVFLTYDIPNAIELFPGPRNQTFCPFFEAVWK